MLLLARIARLLTAFAAGVCLIAGLAAAAESEPLHLGKSLGEWRAALDAPERLDRLLAARALGEMALADAPGAAQALFEAIKHEDSAVRYWAVVAAGRMGERALEAEPMLDAALKDPAPEVRVWAAFALARLGRVDEAVQILVRELQNPEKGARLQAVHALDDLGLDARGASEALRRAVGDEFGYVGRVARHALFVLGERPCPYQDCGD